MKKNIAALLALLLALLPASGYAAASFSLALSAKEVHRGDEITLSGEAPEGAGDIAVKIVSPNRTVLYIDVLTSASGGYSASVTIPDNAALAPYGVYTVVAGTGGLSATETFTVIDPNPEEPGEPGNPGEPEEPGGGGHGPTKPAAPDVIPPNAGEASGSVIKPEPTSDGRYVFGGGTLAEAIGQAKDAVTVELPASAGESGSALEFPAAAMSELQAKALDLIVISGSRTIRFPAGALKGSDEQPARLRIVLNGAWTDEAKAAVERSLQSQAGYKATGVVLSVTIELINGDSVAQIHRLDKPAAVSIGLTEERLNSIATNLAGIYNVDGSEPVYAGGVPGGGKFAFKAEHFSYYALLEYDKPFADMTGHWAESAVKSLVAKHVVTGVDERHYEPSRGITRAEFATMLMRSVDWTGRETAEPPANPFKDVPSGRYYTEQVAKAAALGIVKGYGGEFRPNDRITREEAVVALVRAANYFNHADADKGAPAFADAKEISSWAAEAVAEAWSQGLIEGDGGRFHPKNPVTRAEVAVMIDRLLTTGNE